MPSSMPIIAACCSTSFGHVHVGRTVAKRIDQAISAMPSYPNCQQLTNMANSIGKVMIEQGRLKDREYDRVTIMAGCLTCGCGEAKSYSHKNAVLLE